VFNISLFKKKEPIPFHKIDLLKLDKCIEGISSDLEIAKYNFPDSKTLHVEVILSIRTASWKIRLQVERYSYDVIGKNRICAFFKHIDKRFSESILTIPITGSLDGIKIFLKEMNFEDPNYDQSRNEMLSLLMKKVIPKLEKEKLKTSDRGKWIGYFDEWFSDNFDSVFLKINQG
jgi:hypothetical protein